MGGGRKLLALALAALVARAAGLYESDGDVVMLDSGNFHEVVADSNAVVAVSPPPLPLHHAQPLDLLKVELLP